jgi:hypothetical protein
VGDDEGRHEQLYRASSASAPARGSVFS